MKYTEKQVKEMKTGLKEVCASCVQLYLLVQGQKGKWVWMSR